MFFHMPYIDGVWSYADRDYVLTGGIDPTRRALERLQRRIEEFLFDADSENHGDYMFLAWAHEQADHDKSSSGTLHEAIMGQEFNAKEFLKEPAIKYEDGDNVIARKRREAVGRASSPARKLAEAAGKLKKGASKDKESK